MITSINKIIDSSNLGEDLEGIYHLPKYNWKSIILNRYGTKISSLDDVEKFHCTMMIFAVENAFSYALNKTEYSELWNDEFEITEEFANAIEEAIEDIKEDDIYHSNNYNKILEYINNLKPEDFE